MAWYGVLLGLGAATAQSLSYVFSRLYVVRRQGGVLRLLVLGHVLMGAASVLMLPAVWPERMPPVGQFVWPLIGSTVFYLLGQAGMFLVLRHAEASTVSPLLGLKIPMLAAITVGLLGGALVPMQWLAVAASVAATFALSRYGSRLGLRNWVAILLTCLGYSLADLNVRALVVAMAEVGPVRSVFLSVCLRYLLCGVVAMAALPWSGRAVRGDWRFAAPWAATWLGAMLLLYGCFATVGVVYGNILQSTRGLISVLMGAMVAGAGMEHLERRVARRVLARRIVAACLMVAAIALYALGG